MSTENQYAIHKQMDVYSSDNSNLGKVAEVYQDSFLLHTGLFATNRYIPYELITSVENDRVNLRLSKDEAAEMKWERRPDYEHHLGDPTQLFYDRGHGIHDPFDRANPHQA
jgi:hypothetical protein